MSEHNDKGCASGAVDPRVKPGGDDYQSGRGLLK